MQAGHGDGTLAQFVPLDNGQISRSFETEHGGPSILR